MQENNFNSFSSKSLLTCLTQCAKYCQCGTVTYENKLCTLLKAIPLVANIETSNGTDIYLSNFELNPT